MGFQSLWGNLPPNVLDLETGPSCGGGEESTLRIAAGFVERGHTVDCWWYGKRGTWRGVNFHTLHDPLSTALITGDYDAICAWSTIIPLQWGKPGAVRLFFQQLNDLWSPGDWSTVDCIVSPSRDHANHLHLWGWHDRPWTVCHNGLDIELYNGPAWKDRGMNVGHWSSPDRGLHHLLKAWPEVVKRVPSAKLHVFYEIDRWIDSGAARALGCYGDRARLLFNELLPRAKADPSIKFYGQVTRKELAKVQVQCRVQCYPYQPIDYCEGFGGAVNQGIAAGCHVLLTPHDAFPTLYGDAVTWLPGHPAAMDRVLADTVVRALTDEPWSQARVATAAPNRAKYTWASASEEAERAIHGDWDSAHGA